MKLPDIRDPSSKAKEVSESMDQEILILYRKKIYLMEREILKLTDEKAELQRNFEAITTLMRSKEKQTSEKRASVDLPKIKVQPVEQNSNENDEELFKMRETIRQLKERETSLTVEIKELQRKLDKQESGFNLRLERSTKQVEELQKMTAKTDGDTAKLNNKISEIKKIAQEREKTLKDKIEDLVAKEEATRLRLSKMSVSKDAELEKKIKSLEELLARKDEESIAFVKEKAENKAKMEKVFEAVVQKENEIKIKEQKIIELNAFIGELSSRIETKTSEIKYLSQIIENEKALADKMARDMQKINVAKMNESSEIEQLNREKEKLTKELELAFKLLKEQKSRNKENERKLADLKESNIKLYTEEKNNLIEKITLLNEKLKENELKNAAETAKLHKLSDDMRTILWHYINSFADNCSFITTSLFERISKTEDRLKQLNLKIDSKATMLKENYKLSPFAAANFFIIQSSSHFTQIEALKQKLNEAEKKAKLKKKKRETKKEEMRLLFVEKERQLKEIILAKTKAEEKAINVIESKKRVEGFTSHLKSSLESIKVALDTVGYQVHCYYCATRDDVYVSTCGHSFCIRCVGKGAECPDCKLAADKGTINKNLLAIGKKIDLMSNLQEDIASTVKDIDKELWEK